MYMCIYIYVCIYNYIYICSLSLLFMVSIYVCVCLYIIYTYMCNTMRPRTLSVSLAGCQPTARMSDIANNWGTHLKSYEIMRNQCVYDNNNSKNNHNL